jgi:hypothetical protein
MTDAPTSAAVEEATWFKVLLVLRWPVALVLCAALLGGVLLRVLSRPIPIRLAMPLDQPLAVRAEVAELAKPIRVDQLDSSIGITLNESVRLGGSVAIEAANPIPISGEPRVVVSSPVEVKAAAPLPVQGAVDVTAAVRADSPLPVQGRVDVNAERPLPVQGTVDVATPKPIHVDSHVRIDSQDSPVQIRLKGGFFGLF